MKELTFCEEWGKKLAAQHPEDLSQEEQAALHQHLSECPQCSEAYTTFKALGNRIRDLPQVVSLPSLSEKIRDIQQDDPPITPPPDSIHILQILADCYDKFFEVSPSEVENAELMVEDVMSRILLALFGGGSVDEATVEFTSDSHLRLLHGSIKISAQCDSGGFALYPSTMEHMKQSIEKSVCSLLREIFGLVKINSVTLTRLSVQFEEMQSEEPLPMPETEGAAFTKKSNKD